MENSIPIYTVDAFTSEPFRGNPAAVCILKERMPDTLMQDIAAEMNLSETAFLIKNEKGFDIRFFTPEAEIPLCGHATLASAHILYESRVIAESGNLTLISKAGQLLVSKSENWITLDFPAYGSMKKPVPEEAASTLGLIPSEFYETEHGWSMAVFGSETEVLSLHPDFKAMKGTIFGHLIATAPSADPSYDFCVRCFVPSLGIDEDPVTGSAHCALIPFWHNRTGKEKMISRQVSARGGILKVCHKGKRVNISGEARTIVKGQLLL